MSARGTFGSRFKEIRKQLGFSQSEFAEIINISQGFLSDLEKDKKICGSNVLLELKKNFNININWLLAGYGDMFLEEKDLKEGETEAFSIDPGIRYVIKETAELTAEKVARNIYPFIIAENKSSYPVIDKKNFHNETYIEDNIIDCICLPPSWNVIADFVIKDYGDEVFYQSPHVPVMFFIKKQTEVRNNDIVAVSIYENMEFKFSLKKIKVLSDKIFLLQDNDITEFSENMKIIGVVTFWMTEPGDKDNISYNYFTQKSNKSLL
jgi:transcriptional regulator with XRE-family HTH domain